MVTPKGDNENYKFENSIFELFEVFTEQDEDGVYVNLPDYDATGPNSNGFVVSLVKNADGGVSLTLGIRGFGEGETEDYDKAIYNYLLKGVEKMKGGSNSKPTIPKNREHPGSAGSADDQKRKSKHEEDEN